jgi:hypothetical protein
LPSVCAPRFCVPLSSPSSLYYNRHAACMWCGLYLLGGQANSSGASSLMDLPAARAQVIPFDCSLGLTADRPTPRAISPLLACSLFRCTPMCIKWLFQTNRCGHIFGKCTLAVCMHRKMDSKLRCRCLSLCIEKPTAFHPPKLFLTLFATVSDFELLPLP